MSDILKTISKSTALKFIVNPLYQIADDIKQISRGRKIPEHVIHIIMTSAALILGIAMPFISTGYGGWVVNLMSSLGLTGSFTNATSKVFFSGWLFSYSTAAITEWSTMAICKGIFGDWNYRLTSKQCLETADDLAIDSVEMRERFNELVMLYRNPPKITGITPDYVRRILDRLLWGDFGAIADHDGLRKVIKDRKQTLESRRAKLKQALGEESEELPPSYEEQVSIEMPDILMVSSQPILYGLDSYMKLRDLGKNQTLTRHEGLIVKELLRLDEYLTKYKI